MMIQKEQLSQLIVALVAQQALPLLRPHLIMASSVNRGYDEQIRRSGETVNVPVSPEMVANTIVAGGSVQKQNPRLSTVPVTLDTHKEATFEIPDVVNATKGASLQDVVLKYLEPAMVALANAIETDLLRQYPLLTFHTPVGTPGQNPLEATISAAETALFKANVPDSAELHGIVTPEAYEGLRQSARFSEQDKIGTGQAIVTGKVGRINNITFRRSNLVVKTGSGPVTAHGLVYAKDAFVLATGRLPQPTPGSGAVAEYMTDPESGITMRVLTSFNNNELAQQYTVDVLYGANVLRSTHAVEMQS